ncbi:MAG: hypothetical protein JWQ97_3175 [Phenylobacterium sp.]|nr:hypothetical protein [Phenylobacterium sp.]
MQTLAGRTALVTGGSRGIGATAAERLAAAGALVAVHYGANRAAAEAVVARIEGAGGAAFALGADLRRVEEIAALFLALDRELAGRGAEGLDILVNNAGVGGGGSFRETTEAQFDDMFDTNAKGPFFVMQQAIPRLREGGRVVNVGSVAARGAAAPRAAYSASKLVMNSWTLSLAQELAPKKINVNCVAPGAVDTDLIAGSKGNPAFEQMVLANTAFRRLGQASDIADAIMLLVQPEAAWITGQIIEVSGGLRL